MEREENDEGNDSEGSDLDTKNLRVTATVGVISRTMPPHALYDAGRCAGVTASALQAHQGTIPEFFMQHVSVTQGPNLVPAGIVAVEVPPSDDPEWNGFNEPAFRAQFLTFSLSLEGCPYTVKWPQEANV